MAHFNIDDLVVDLHPTILGTLLIELGLATAETLHFKSSPVVNEQVREVIGILPSKETQNLTVIVKGKSDFRSPPGSKIPVPEHLSGIVPTLERESTYFRVLLQQMERLHLLSVSDFLRRLLNVPDHLTDQQQRLLAYYLPFANQIRGDLKLTQHCIQSAISQPVLLTPEPSRYIRTKGTQVNELSTGKNRKVGGRRKSPKTLIKLKIGPVPSGQLEHFIRGGQHRTFLETVLLPSFFPTNWEWSIQLKVQKESTRCRVSGSTAGICRIGINAIIQQ